ncbi:uncharacterized protein raw isoform X2 [Planococcus citri]|uniref:uncharacterized protein raw isoform X2 n=1 Tax=Planococcus citri TaxID=170843 RepID=UPI0031F9DF78
MLLFIQLILINMSNIYMLEFIIILEIICIPKREVQCAWNSVLGPAASVVPAEKITKLFNHLEIYPNNVQVHEMLQCAQKCAGRNSSKYLTFAEFCIFATELKKSIHSRIYRCDYFSKLLRKDEHIKNKRIRKMSDFASREVFLGGSCNPTTWRQDEAIPILEKYGISYFNPQVSDWSPELIETEHRAKQNSSILLYVINNQTRNVVSLIETVNFLGSRRKLAIVINYYKGPGQIIAGESISADEFNELNSSLVLSRQLVERRKNPVFSEVPEAVKYVVDVIHGSNRKIEEVKNGQRIMKMKEAFESLDTDKSGLISSKDICKALCLLTQKRSQSAELRKNILQKIDSNKTNNHNVKVNFEQFCKIVSELNLTCDKKYLNGNIDKRTNRSNFLRSLSTPDDKPTFTDNGIHLTDIYLGGDCHQGLNWRQKIAIPKLRNSCLTFFNPENERISNGKLSPSEFAVINNSSVLLFVITNTSRALFTMVLASYYLGVGADIVLCIQQLPDQCVIGSDKLSQQAVKDYNRGRLYLADLARRENVPIYESISDAVEAAITKCIK